MEFKKIVLGEEHPARFEITHHKTVKDITGKDVTIIDGVELIFLSELEEQKTKHEDILAQINEKINGCKAL